MGVSASSGISTTPNDAHLEALAALLERGRAGRQHRVDAVAARADQHAELVAAEPVGVAVVADRLAETRGQAHEQPVAGRWPNASLYSLKPSRSNSSSARGAPSDARPSWISRSASRLRRFRRPVSESVRASVWVCDRIRWFSEASGMPCQRASSRAHAARLTAAD